MFACIGGGYPREPLAAQPDRLGDADRLLAAGEITRAEHTAVMADVVREVLREQELSGLAILADGGVTHVDRLAYLVEGLGGTASGPVLELPDGEAVRAPRFDGPVDWRGPITLEGWTLADSGTDLLVKQVLVGPWTIASLAEGPGPARARLALALGEALNAEVRALMEAGCPIVEIEEGSVNTIGDDREEWSRYAATQRRLTAGLDNEHLTLSLCGWRGPPGRLRRHPRGSVQELPHRRTGRPRSLALRVRHSAGSRSIAGAVDAREPTRDEAEVMVWAAAWAAEGGRGHERVGLAPNASRDSCPGTSPGARSSAWARRFRSD